MDRITCEVMEHIGTIGENRRGWALEVNIVAWNGAGPKYDIRHWNDDHSEMTKGVTLTEEQARALAGVLKGRFE